jgi:hypothetical protein
MNSVKIFDHFSNEELIDFRRLLSHPIDLNKDQKEKIKQIFFTIAYTSSCEKLSGCNLLEKIIFQINKKIYFHFYEKKSCRIISQFLNFHLEEKRNYYEDLLLNENDLKKESNTLHLLKEFGKLVNQDLGFQLKEEQKQILQTKLTELFGQEEAIGIMIRFLSQLHHLYKKQLIVLDTFNNQDSLLKLKLKQQNLNERVGQLVCFIYQNEREYIDCQQNFISDKELKQVKSEAAYEWFKKEALNEPILSILTDFFSFFNYQKPLDRMEKEEWDWFYRELCSFFDSKTSSRIRQLLYSSFQEFGKRRGDSLDELIKNEWCFNLEDSYSPNPEIQKLMKMVRDKVLELKKEPFQDLSLELIETRKIEAAREWFNALSFEFKNEAILADYQTFNQILKEMIRLLNQEKELVLIDQELKANSLIEKKWWDELLDGFKNYETPYYQIRIKIKVLEKSDDPLKTDKINFFKNLRSKLESIQDFVQLPRKFGEGLNPVISKEPIKISQEEKELKDKLVLLTQDVTTVYQQLILASKKGMEELVQLNNHPIFEKKDHVLDLSKEQVDQDLPSLLLIENKIGNHLESIWELLISFELKWKELISNEKEQLIFSLIKQFDLKDGYPEEVNEVILKLNLAELELDKIKTLLSKRITLIQDPASPLAINPFINLKYAFKLIASKTEDYHLILVPIIKSVAYAISKDDKEAKQLVARWENHLERIGKKWQESGSEYHINDELSLYYINQQGLNYYLNNICRSLSYLSKLDISLESIFSAFSQVNLSILKPSFSIRDVLKTTQEYQKKLGKHQVIEVEESFIFTWIHKLTEVKAAIYDSNPSSPFHLFFSEEAKQKVPSSIRFLWASWILILGLDPILDPTLSFNEKDLRDEKNSLEKGIAMGRLLSSKLQIFNWINKIPGFNIGLILEKILGIIQPLVSVEKLNNKIDFLMERKVLEALQEKEVFINGSKVEPELMQAALKLSDQPSRKEIITLFVDIMVNEWNPLSKLILNKFLSNKKLTGKAIEEIQQMFKIYEEFAIKRIHLIDICLDPKSNLDKRKEEIEKVAISQLELYHQIFRVIQIGIQLIKDSPANSKLIKIIDSILTEIKGKELPKKKDAFFWIKTEVFSKLSTGFNESYG